MATLEIEREQSSKAGVRPHRRNMTANQTMDGFFSQNTTTVREDALRRSSAAQSMCDMAVMGHHYKYKSSKGGLNKDNSQSV